MISNHGAATVFPRVAAGNLGHARTWIAHALPHPQITPLQTSFTTWHFNVSSSPARSASAIKNLKPCKTGKLTSDTKLGKRSTINHPKVYLSMNHPKMYVTGHNTTWRIQHPSTHHIQHSLQHTTHNIPRSKADHKVATKSPHGQHRMLEDGKGEAPMVYFRVVPNPHNSSRRPSTLTSSRKCHRLGNRGVVCPPIQHVHCRVRHCHHHHCSSFFLRRVPREVHFNTSFHKRFSMNLSCSGSGVADGKTVTWTPSAWLTRNNDTYA